jgi:hypothetical protein
MSCRDNIIQAIKEGKLPKMSAAEAEAIIAEVDRIREFVGERDGIIGEGFRAEVQKQLDYRRRDRLVKTVEAKNNLLKLDANIRFVQQEAFQGSPEKAILGRLLGGELRYSKGGNRGAAVVAEGNHASRANGMYSKLKEIGLLESAEKGAIDRDVAQEIHLIDLNRTGETKNEQAAQVAKIFRAATDSMLNEKRAAGSWVRRAEGYIAKTTHDRELIQSAGFEAWKEDILKSIDRQKTYGFSSNEAVDTSLAAIYDNIINGETSPGVFEAKGKNFSSEQSLARKFIFKDGYSWFDYNQKYGKGNLLETILRESKKSSAQAALMEQFGTNPELGVARLFQSIEKDIPQEKRKAKRKEVEAAFTRASGFSDVPGTELAAKAGQVARVIQSLSKTGGAAISTMTDLAFSVSHIASNTGNNLLGETATQIGTWLSGIADKEKRAAAASRLGVLIDHFQADLLDKYGVDTAKPGLVARASQIFQKLNGMKYIDASAAYTGAMHHAMALADHANTPWHDLDPRVRLGLERYGFNDESWALSMQAVEEVNGHRVMTPEAIRELPDETVKAIYGAGVNPNKVRYQVSNNLISAYNETVYASASRGSPRVKHTTLGDSLDDGSWGTLRRLLVQFKEPMLMNLRTAGETLLSNPQTQPKTLLSAAGGKGDFYGFAGLFMLSTMLGYAKIAAKDAASGLTPPDPKDPKTATRAFLAGGVGGIYGDLLFSEMHRQYGVSTLETLSGPSITEGGKILDIGRKALNGEATWDEVFKKSWDNTPGHNLFYFKAAADYLISNNIREYLRPGYKQRLESRLRDRPGAISTNQEYFMFQPTR